MWYTGIKCLYIVRNKNSYTKNSKLKLIINLVTEYYTTYFVLLCNFQFEYLESISDINENFIIFIGMEITKISLKQYKIEVQ